MQSWTSQLHGGSLIVGIYTTSGNCGVVQGYKITEENSIDVGTDDCARKLGPFTVLSSYNHPVSRLEVTVYYTQSGIKPSGPIMSSLPTDHTMSHTEQSLMRVKHYRRPTPTIEPLHDLSRTFSLHQTTKHKRAKAAQR
jgi:hypothetical protein